MAEIILQDVSKSYDGLTAVDNMNLHIPDKEFFVILGPSGAGKTTTLKMIAGVESVSEGTISINGMAVNALPPEKRNVAMVFESYALYSHLSVFENISFPLHAPGMPDLSREEIKSSVYRVASLLKIDTLLDRKPSELSGGQRQRVALGRAMVRKPDVFLLDEPLSHLDAKIRSQMRSELKKLQDSVNTTIIYVTHDYNEALALADRIAVLDRGKIQQIGTPDEVYYSPANTFVAESFGDPPINFLEGILTDINGTIHFNTDDGKTVIPAPPGTAEKLKQWKGEQITLGVRPQYIIPSRIPEGEFHVEGKVFIQEILGDDSNLSVTVGDSLFMAQTKPDISYALDETVYLTWDNSLANYFSHDTGINLLV